MKTIVNSVSLEQVRKVPLRKPRHVRPGQPVGKDWQGIRHADLVDQIVETCEGRGWHCTGIEFFLSNDKADLMGGFDITTDYEIYTMFFQTSNAFRSATKFYVGGIHDQNDWQVYDEMTVVARHTKTVDLQVAVGEGLDWLSKVDMTEIGDELIGESLTYDQLGRLLLDTGRHGLLPWSRVGQVWDAIQWDPTVTPVIVKDDVYAAFSEVVMDKEPPFRRLEELLAFYRLLRGDGRPALKSH